MLKQYSIAKRYAKALFLTLQAKQKDSLATVKDFLCVFTVLMEQNLSLQEAFVSPAITQEEKKMLFVALFTRVLQNEQFALLTSEVVTCVERLFLLLITLQRMAIFPLIQRAFVQLYNEYTGILHVAVETAYTCSEAEKSSIEMLFTKQGKKPFLEYTVNSEILGGFVVRVNNFLLDVSLKKVLEELKSSMIRGVQHAH